MSGEGRFKGKYRIESARLRNYDYSLEGAYFVTICTKDREHFLGEIVDDEMQLSRIGETVAQYWQKIPEYFLFVVLDEFVVMPNHMHGIIMIHNGDFVETRHGASLHLRRFGSLQPNSLSSIVNHLKGNITRWCRKNNYGYFHWQSRFYDRIIRNEKELNNIREYIQQNPLKWHLDENNV